MACYPCPCLFLNKKCHLCSHCVLFEITNFAFSLDFPHSLFILEPKFEITQRGKEQDSSSIPTLIRNYEKFTKQIFELMLSFSKLFLEYKCTQWQNLKSYTLLFEHDYCMSIKEEMTCHLQPKYRRY